MSGKLKKLLYRIIIALVIFIPLLVCEHLGAFEQLPYAMVVVIFVVPYLIAGYDILLKAAKNIRNGQVFDENFLMIVATVGAFGVKELSEAVAVMIFYQVGELFQGYAVGKSRQAISDMMDIAPEYANLEVQDGIEEVDPDEVEIGSIIVVKPGEKIPLDGIVIEGESFVDTSALTGESVPRKILVGDDIISGCINGSNTIRVRTTKEYDDSTVAKILEMVENAGEKKAKTENFITRFAKYYTPAVTIAAVLLAIVPPILLSDDFGKWIIRACTFLVVSCPCALVISVPMGFFGGIGAASKLGVLVKGSNYLELMAGVDTIVFDKTGTLTKGEFKVSKLLPANNVSEQELLDIAAVGESYSTHPIAMSIIDAHFEQVGSKPEMTRATQATEKAGFGVTVTIDGIETYLGNEKLLSEKNIQFEKADEPGTVVYVARTNQYLGAVIISDTIKDKAPKAIANMKKLGVEKTVMLTGDRERVASYVADEIGIDVHYSELLPGDKVDKVEMLLAQEKNKSYLAFVGDGINDAPVLTRADVGIAMGSMGSDAAIEAADIVLMDDDISKIASVVKVARKTLGIVRQNIVLALGVKLLVLVLSAFGITNMWAAVFADVGVAVLAILNAMRALKIGK